MSNKWAKMLNKMEGAVDREYNPYEKGNYVSTASPSLNWTFSKCGGLPFGESLLLWGPPKSGKSIISNLFVAGLHKMDPEAIAIKFDTEMREAGHVEDFWGIDEDRFIVYNANEPELIFDRIKNDIHPLIEAGMPLKMIIIDSMAAIQGVKAANADSITSHQMGDRAITIQKGLMAILPIIRRNKIAFIATEQIRGNLDAGMYGPKEKMSGAFFEKHAFEYYMKVNRNNKKAETHKSITGEEFTKDIKDFKGNKEITAHKIYAQMSESSRGVAGRTGQLTFSYENGIINIEEEIFELSKNMNIVERPNNRTYIYGGHKYNSKNEFINAIKNDENVRNQLLEQINNK